MKKLLMKAHGRSMEMAADELAASRLTLPQLTLSSEQAGWEGLVVEAFQEPKEMEGWIVSTNNDIALLLYAGGGLHVERRRAHEPWKGADIYAGEMVLNWGQGTPYEARWWSLSDVPTQTLDIHLSREMVARVAEEVVGVDLASLELVRRIGFRDPLLTQIALALWRELEQPGPAGKLYAQTAAQLIALHLVRHYAPSTAALRNPPPSPPGLTERQVRHVLEFIQAHLNEDLSLDTLARQVGFSPYHFARLFRRATGASLHQVVLRQRIERAERLLQETDMPLAHVASACGFAHQSHLTQVLREHLGCTPRAYRRAVGRHANFYQIEQEMEGAG